MARRGFLAEIQHQARVAEREAERRRRTAVCEHAAAVRRAEHARKEEERAWQQTARARETERKRLEKEAHAAHIAAMEAEVDQRNAELAEICDEIDNLLSATLGVDDYVDLHSLRRTAEHPAFDRTDLESPIPPPGAIPDPAEPVFIQPEPPKGLFGRKKKYDEAVAAAEAAHAQALAAWRAKLESNSILRKVAAEEHARAERDRVVALAEECARYEAECSAREDEAAEHNARIDTLMTNLGYGSVDAVQEYVSIVLSNSVYPEPFQVDHNFTFDPATAELKMRVVVPPPSKLPNIKAYKYTRSADEISATTLSLKACKDRYAAAVHQVALRSLHEILRGGPSRFDQDDLP